MLHTLQIRRTFFFFLAERSPKRQKKMSVTKHGYDELHPSDKIPPDDENSKTGSKVSDHAYSSGDTYSTQGRSQGTAPDRV